MGQSPEVLRQRKHAVIGACLNGTVHLMSFAVTDKIFDGCRANHNLKSGYSAPAVCPGEQGLADHGSEAERHLQADLWRLPVGKDVYNTVNG